MGSRSSRTRNSDNRKLVCNALIDPASDSSVQAMVARQQFIYSQFGLLVGAGCMVGGVYLFIKGITGSLDWNLQILGASSELSNAAPGAVLFIVGVFVIFITRYVFKHHKM